MGFVLLAVFVLASLGFSVWAWRRYNALAQPQLDNQTDRPAFVISIVAIVLYSLSLELLARYTKLPFIERVAVTGAAILLVQFLAFRVLNRVQKG